MGSSRRRVAAAGLVLAVGGVLLSSCVSQPAPLGTSCQFPRSATAVDVAVDASAQTNQYVTYAVLSAISDWNTLGGTHPSFVGVGSPAQGRVNVSMWNDPFSTTLGSTTLPCRPGGWAAVNVSINVGRLFVLADPTNRSIWVGNHEFGHALGLGHLGEGQQLTTCPGSVMWWSDAVWNQCNQNRPSSLVDAPAANALYD